MSAQESSYLLGVAFALLTQARGALIALGATEQLISIETEYQELKDGIERVYYQNKDQKNAKS